LRLPPSTRFIAGFAREGQDIADQRFILELIERCLGRRTPEAAARALARIAEVAA
jgi:hypothetical protein